MSQRSTPPPGRRPRDLRRRDQPSSRAARAQGHPARRGPGRADPRMLAAAGALGIVLIAAAFVLAGGLGGGSTVPTLGPGASRAAGACPTSQPAALAAGETRTVTIQTAKGTIVIQVKGSLSPIAAGNFAALAGCGFYDGSVFHRLVPGFVIQGGQGASGDIGYTIADEPITATYHRGTVAMARTTQAHSQSSQFFIVLSDEAASSLTQTDPSRGYAIFGEVTSGMDVVDAIAAMPNSGQPNNTALDPVAMTSVTIANP